MDQQIDNSRQDNDSLPLSQHHAQTIEAVIQLVKELPSLAERKNLTSKQVESLYGLGYQLYEAQCYQEAADLLRCLCFFESRVADHWIALGGAYQHTKHHDNALAAFTMACLLDPHNPAPRFYTAHTLIDLKDLSLALESINIAIELCHHKPEYLDLYRRSMGLKHAIALHLHHGGHQVHHEKK